MTTEPTSGDSARQPTAGTDAAHPEELPPVTPPSAGFIIQLFLIPALIVMAVIGVWALFGKIAGSEVNWERLVAEVANGNENRRWRAAQNLAQVLHQEELARIPEEDRLSSRREVALALTHLFRESLASPSTLDKEMRNQEFLARVMGTFQVDDLVLPVLAEAMDPVHDLQVRRSAMMSVALIAGRNFGEATGQSMKAESATGLAELSALPAELNLPLAEPSISDEAIHEQLRSAAQDEEPTVRQLAAYGLGLVSGPDAIEQLHVMLLDSDSSTRANAAVALARNADPGGVAVMMELLELGANPLSKEQFAKLSEQDQQAELARLEFEEPTALLTCLTAVGRLWNRISADEQQQLRKSVSSLAEDYASAAIRFQAGELLREIGE